MIRRILILVRKDFLHFTADPVAIALGFVVPMVMILVFGLVFGRSGGAIGDLDVLAVCMDDGPAGRRLVSALDAQDEIRIIETLRGDSVALDSARARARVARGFYGVALIIPSDFSAGLQQGQARFLLLHDPRNPIAAGLLGGLLQRQIFTSFPGVLAAGMMQQSFSQDSLQAMGFDRDLRRAIETNFHITLPDCLSLAGTLPASWLLGSDPDTSAAADTPGFNFGAALKSIVRIETEAVVGQNIVNPGIAQSVAGPAVMFLLFAVGAIAASLLREMHFGTAFRLLTGGVRAGELLFSKFLYAILLGSSQLVVMFIYGRVIFGLQILDQPLALAVMILCTAASTSALGLIIAAVARTEEQAAGYQVVVILAMSAIGGAMFPSFMIPAGVRTLAAITPVHWAMQGFLDVLWRAQSLPGILAEAGILLGMAAVMATAAIILFRRRLRLDLG